MHCSSKQKGSEGVKVKVRRWPNAYRGHCKEAEKNRKKRFHGKKKIIGMGVNNFLKNQDMF